MPTLVLHCQANRVSPLDEGRHVARQIPGAHFVELPGSNHVLLEGTPAFEQYFEEVSDFLAKHDG